MARPIRQVWETTDAVQHESCQSAKAHQGKLDFDIWYESNQLLNVPSVQMIRWLEANHDEVKELLRVL